MLIYISHFGNYYIVLRAVSEPFFLFSVVHAFWPQTKRFVPNEDKYENIDYGTWTISCLTERIYYFNIFENHIVSYCTRNYWDFSWMMGKVLFHNCLQNWRTSSNYNNFKYETFSTRISSFKPLSYCSSLACRQP